MLKLLDLVFSEVQFIYAFFTIHAQKTNTHTMTVPIIDFAA